MKAAVSIADEITDAMNRVVNATGDGLDKASSDRAKSGGRTCQRQPDLSEGFHGQSGREM